MADILLLQDVALYMGDADPTKSKHLQLTSMALPTLETETAEHMPGGGVMGVEFGMGILKPLKPTFKLAGFDEESFKLFKIGTGQVDTFTGYGVIVSKQAGKRLQAKTIIRGTIGKIGPDEFERSKMFGHDHSIIEVTRYELHVGGKEWWYVDFWTSTIRRFGSEDRERQAMLGLI